MSNAVRKTSIQDNSLLKNTRIIVIWKGYVENILQTARNLIIVISRYLNPTREKTKYKFQKTQEKTNPGYIQIRKCNQPILSGRKADPTNYFSIVGIKINTL
jgi:hypothetical protein